MARRVSSPGASSLSSSRVIAKRSVARARSRTPVSGTSRPAAEGLGYLVEHRLLSAVSDSRAKPARIGLRSAASRSVAAVMTISLAADAFGLVQQHPVGLDARAVVVPEAVQRACRVDGRATSPVGGGSVTLPARQPGRAGELAVEGRQRDPFGTVPAERPRRATASRVCTDRRLARTSSATCRARPTAGRGSVAEHQRSRHRGSADLGGARARPRAAARHRRPARAAARRHARSELCDSQHSQAARRSPPPRPCRVIRSDRAAGTGRDGRRRRSAARRWCTARPERRTLPVSDAESQRRWRRRLRCAAPRPDRTGCGPCRAASRSSRSDRDAPACPRRQTACCRSRREQGSSPADHLVIRELDQRLRWRMRRAGRRHRRCRWPRVSRTVTGTPRSLEFVRRRRVGPACDEASHCEPGSRVERDQVDVRGPRRTAGHPAARHARPGR